MTSKKTVLVVEDNMVNRSLLCQILADEYHVLEAGNGQEALEMLQQHGGEIALILLDIVMPVMDGYTFLSIIKENPSYSAIPVIVTTQQDSESDELLALSHGATDFVVKPYKTQIILHRVASLINLMDLQKAAAIVDLLQTDRLTGLFNKEYFYQRVKEVLEQNPDKEYDVICSNIENFKLINDALGIPTADRLLCNIAEMYREKIKDIGICGRLNADRFGCLIEHKWEYTDEMFQTGLQQVNDLSESKNIIMKWGIYSVKNDTASVEQMFDRALLAVQSIRGQYGKYYAVYDDAMRSQLQRMQEIVNSMESALEERQFELYLQPKYQISNGTLIGAEALVRWNHPEWGMQSPAEFIPLFEKNGFITKLDRYVWNMACEILQDWDARGIDWLPISVNVSRADIYHADIAEILLEAVTQHGLPPERLHLEITESAYTESPQQIIDTIEHLQKLGFVIEMDDFGSGYSSLNMLDKLPVDILKLDLKFIQNDMGSTSGGGILQFIMLLARWKELSVVAEGVETKEQLDRLQQIGCDCAQGYYLAKPMPVKKFEALLARLQNSGDCAAGK